MIKAIGKNLSNISQYPLLKPFLAARSFSENSYDLQEIESRCSAIATELQQLRQSTSHKDKLEEKRFLEKELNKSDIWSDQERASKLTARNSYVEKYLNWLETSETTITDSVELAKLATEVKDTEELIAVLNAIEKVERDYKKFTLENFLSDPSDRMSCFMQINAGAGGTDSFDWAKLLANMYCHWAISRQFSVSNIDEQVDLSTGIGVRSATYRIQGMYSYGYMKMEAGVHRLVRISPFDSQGKRHTSFAQLLVYPDFGDSTEFTQIIDQKDIRVDTYRSSGAGGQHVNTTDSAVRLTHVPTGLVATCQNERSQHQNKASALEVLKAKIWQHRKEEQQKVVSAATLGVGENSWGNQIRSVVMHPYTMVKDHRTGWSSSNIEAYLKGELLDDAIQSSFKVK